jgi:hypothetical protein
VTTKVLNNKRLLQQIIKIHLLLVIGFSAILAGCTKVIENRPDMIIHHVCIVENPYVTVPGFKQNLLQSFHCRGIKVSWVKTYNILNSCDTTVYYFAKNNSNAGSYLATVNIKLYNTHNQDLIGSYYYHTKRYFNSSTPLWSSADGKMPHLMNGFSINNKQCQIILKE